MPRRKKTEEAAPVPDAAEQQPAEETPVVDAERPADESVAESPAELVPEMIPDEPDAEEPVRLSSIERMVLFKLGERQFGLPIGDVQEIQQIVALTEFPDTSPALIGMVNLRGSVVPVIDLRVLIGMERAEYTLETPMIVCRRGAQLVALIVDEVDDVIELPEDCLQPASRLYELADKILGVCRMDSELIFLLDLAALVPEEDLAAFDGIARGV